MSRHLRRTAALLLSIVASLGMTTSVLAHAELESATPADGSVLAAPPAEIVFTYTEELDPDSTLILVDAAGIEVARAGVDAADPLSMRIEPPELQPGTYEVRSTAIAAHDGAIDRETVGFTILEPTPSPTVEPTATPAPSGPPAATPSPSPSPSPATSDPAGGNASDVLLPVIAALVIALAFGAWLLRNRSRRAA